MAKLRDINKPMDVEIIDAKRVEDISSSDLVDGQMRIYTEDLVSRQYPHVIDGLKKVQRRILWVLNTSDELFNLIRIIGHTEDLHTSGDSSIYSALVRMAQPFHTGHPLIFIKGNGGSYSKEQAAHPRYIQVSTTEFGRDILFNRCVKKALPLVYSKNFDSEEPLYFIPCIPTALLYNHLTIGIGYKSESPQLNLNNLCELVMKQVDIRTSTFGLQVPHNIIAKYLIPDFPINNYLMNRDELLKEYGQGNFEHPIRLNGMMEFTNNSIVLKACAYGVSYYTLYCNLTDKLTDSKIKHWLLNYINGYSDFSDKEPNFTIDFKNKVDIFELLSKLRATLEIEGAIHPRYYYTYDDNPLHKTPPQLLSIWYDERKRSILSGIKYQHMQLTQNKLEKQARLIICERTDDVIHILRNSENPIKELTDTFPTLTKYQATIIYNAPMHTLTKLSKIKIEEDIARIDLSIQDTVARYGKIDETIYNDAQYVKKKYGKKRMTKFIDEMIGYVKVGDTGIMQYESPEDLYAILSRNPNNSKAIQIFTYHPYLPNKVAYSEQKALKYKYTTIPKEFKGTAVLEYPNNPVTFCRIEDGSAFIPGIKIPNDNQKRGEFQYTTKKCYGLTLNGNVIELDESSISSRKSISRGAKSNIIYVIPGNCKDMIVFHMHPLEPNTLRMDRILHNDNLGKCVFTPTNALQVLDIQPVNTNFIALNIPQDCINKVAIEHLIIENVKGFFENGPMNLIINLSRGSKQLKKHPDLQKMSILKG